MTLQVSCRVSSNFGLLQGQMGKKLRRITFGLPMGSLVAQKLGPSWAQGEI